MTRKFKPSSLRGKQLMALVLLQLLRFPSRFQLNILNSCFVAALHRLVGSNIYDSPESVGLDYKTYDGLLTMYRQNPRLERTLNNRRNYSNRSKSNARTESRVGTIEALKLLTADGAKDVTTSLLAACLDILSKPDNYRQESLSRCILSKAAQYRGETFLATQLEKDMGGNEEFMKLYVVRNWPAMYRNRWHRVKANAKRRGRHPQARTMAMIGVQRTLHFIAYGE